MSLLYNMWPVVMTAYNLPPWLCTKDPYKMLTLLIPGPNAPWKDFDVFVRPFVDKLKEWDEDVLVRDVALKTLFRMRDEGLYLIAGNFWGFFQRIFVL